MEFVFVTSASDVTRLIDENPVREAWFVKHISPGPSGMPLKPPRMQLIECLATVLYALLDFDGTLHPKIQWRAYEAFILKIANGGGPRSAAAARLHKYLCSIGSRYTALKNGDGPTSVRDTFTKTWDPLQADSIESMWAVSILTGMAAYGATRHDLAEIGHNIKLREGAVELLSHELFLMSLIITFGVQDVVESSLSANGLNPSERLRVEGTQLVFEGDYFVGPDPNVLIASSKQRVARLHTAGLNARPNQFLALGDTIFDLKMAPPGALRIFLMPHDRDGSDHSKMFSKIEEAWDGFDVILRSNSLMPLVDLLREAHAS